VKTRDAKSRAKGVNDTMVAPKGRRGCLAVSFFLSKGGRNTVILTTMKEKPLSSYLIYLSLVLLAILSFVFRTHFFYGISVAPLFIMIIIALYGIIIGGSSAALVYTIAIILEEIWLPFAILHIGATLFIGWRLRKNGQGLISHNFLYWIIIGIPILVLFYVVFGEFDDLAIILIQKEVTSTIVFSLLADILISYGPLNMYARAKLQFPKGYFFNRLMVHTSLLALLIPFLVYVIMNGNQEEKRIFDSIDRTMTSRMQAVENYLYKLPSNELYLLKQQGLIQSRITNQMLQMAAENTHLAIYITDQHQSLLTAHTIDSYQIGQLFDWHAGGDVVAEYKGYSYWLPNVEFYNELVGWNHGYVIQEKKLSSIGLTITIITPFSPYLTSLLHIYQPQIWVLFLVCATVLMLHFIYNRVFFSLLTKLAHSTIAIPSKLIDGKELSWPKKGIIEVDALVDNFRTVTEDLKETFNQTHRLAYYDSLTGLANRLCMQKDFTNLFVQSTYGSLAVLFFDLDHFKHINDSLGHSAGDQLLQLTADRLTKVCDEHCHLYRVSGDEFVIIVEQTDMENAQLVAVNILKVVSQPMFIEQNELNITASIGIALYPEHGESPEAVMKEADSAMYVAKENGGNTFSAYAESHNIRFSEK